MHAMQLTLLGRTAPSFDATFRGAERIELGLGAWIERVPGFLSGHELVFDVLHEDTRWTLQERTMYDRVVEVPRLTASLPVDGEGHPVLDEMAEALTDRYGEELSSLSLAFYRDGRDSVAWHGDRHAQTILNAMVATVSLGTPRHFMLRPKDCSGPSRKFLLGWGDLLVMGGDCQHTWEHSVPKRKQPCGPRISVMFRNRPKGA
jgi:alkylated DNA repair dioxygenase AlkB